MTNKQKIKVKQLRSEGMGYTTVAKTLGLSKETVKSFCRRNGLAGRADIAAQETEAERTEGKVCRNCGKELFQTPGMKTRKFCSKQCRETWWRNNPDKLHKKAIYKYVCAYCGKDFEAYGNSARKYCSHDCYIADRFKEKRTGSGTNNANVEIPEESICEERKESQNTSLPTMEPEQFKREVKYHGMMSIAKQMLSEGIINEDEYNRIDIMMLEKYQPIISSLLSLNSKRNFKAED